jgi:hypothetical protein
VGCGLPLFKYGFLIFQKEVRGEFRKTVLHGEQPSLIKFRVAGVEGGDMG